MSNQPRQSGRELSLVIGFLLVIVLFAARLVQFQLFESPRWKGMATQQSWLVKSQRLGRGEILDRNGKRLALTLPLAYAVVYKSKPDHDPDEMSRNVAPLLDVPRTVLREKMSDDGWVQLASTVDFVIKDQLESMYPKRFQFDEKPRRAYPADTVAASVIGFADVDGKGLEGIEKFLDSLLAGKTYDELRRVDAGRRRQASLSSPPLDSLGANITLSLDLRLQTIVEEQLRLGLAEIHCERACVIIVDPSTGDVLALAATPSYNPNDPSKSPAQARHCWPVTDAYEPGSTMKIIPAAMALTSGRLHRDTRIHCENGTYRCRGAVIHDTHPYGVLTLDQILAYSSNIGAVKICSRFVPDEVFETYTAFGFGAVTTIDLPGEQPGSVPHPRNWSNSTQLTLAYGHGISCTPLQLVMAYASIANDGVLMRPRLVMNAALPDGELRVFPPREVRRVMTEEVAQDLTEMLTNVVEYGTGTTVKIENLPIAGKTGTAKKYDPVHKRYFDRRYVSSFAGFFPSDDPKYVMLVVVDDPRGQYYGAIVAGPIFKAIVEEMRDIGYPGLGCEPTPQSLRYAAGESAPHNTRKLVVAPAEIGSSSTKGALEVTAHVSSSDQGKMVLVPDLIGWSLRPAMEELMQKKLSARVWGWRMVVEQRPEPGSIVPCGSVCELRALP